MMKITRKPTTPGEMLREEFLIPLKLKPEELAKRIDYDVNTINKLIDNRESISEGLASKLASVFNTTPDFWLNLQKATDFYEQQISEPLNKSA